MGDVLIFHRRSHRTNHSTSSPSFDLDSSSKNGYRYFPGQSGGGTIRQQVCRLPRRTLPENVRSDNIGTHSDKYEHIRRANFFEGKTN